MSGVSTVFLIVVAAVALFVWNRLPTVVVAMGVALALFLTGILTVEQTFAGFGDPVIIFIASLFVVAAGLEATGVTAWAGQWLARVAGESERRLLVLTMLMVAALSPLISMNGAVTALLPVVMIIAVRMGHTPSKLLMPLAFAAGAGSKLALTGTPKNVLVNDASIDAGYGGFGFFEFALVGIPLLIGTVTIVYLFGRALLPERRSDKLPPDFSRHAETLVEQYRLTSNVVQTRVRNGSLLIGKRRAEIDFSGFPGMSLVAINSGSGLPVGGGVISEGDMLILRGKPEIAGSFAAEAGLAIRDEEDGQGIRDALFNRGSGLAEVVIPPRSALIGTAMYPGMVTEGGDLVVLAIQRSAADLGPGESHLQAGDHMLLQGTWAALDDRLAHPGVLVVDSPDLVRRQAVPLGTGAKTMIAVVIGMVMVLATGAAPPAIAGVLAAGAMVLLRGLSIEQVYRAIDWNTIILIASMMPLSTAMYETGAAQRVADGLVAVVGDMGPTALLAGLFLVAGFLGQVVSNTATTLIMIPIAVASAAKFGISAQPVLMSLNVGASAAFLTPVATPVNLMVMGPAGYRFGDYWRLGLALMSWYFVISVLYVPLVWKQ